MILRMLKYYKPHRRLFIIDLICAFFVGLADEFMPLIVRRMINQYVPEQNWQMMVRWAIALLVIYAVKLCLNLIINYWGHIAGVRMQADMRREIFRHIERLPVSFFDDHKTGAIMSRITNDLQEISEMAHHGPENIFTSVVMLVVSAIMLGRINVKLTCIVYACLPLTVIFILLIRKGQLEAFARRRREIAGINAETETSIAGVRVTKAYSATRQEDAKFDTVNGKYIDASYNAYKYLALFNSGMIFLTDFMYIIVILFGGLFYFQGSINAGDFVAYLLYISMFLSPIKKLVDTYEQIADGMSGYQRFEELLAIPVESDEPDAIDAGKLNGKIEFRHVDFHYSNGEGEEKHVIHDLNLEIAEGHSIGLAGPSGGGKTTICNLIPRFYEIDRGEICIDGINIKHFTRESLRRNIGIVAQDVFLFNGTIKDNIAYGNPDATDEEIMLAARKAEIHEDIMKMPHGYETNVGERGVHLSGGQRQRISIARVFLKDPRILILDEATSALDNATEMAIQRSLNELAKGRTVITVAHRLSTIHHADEIIILTSDGIKERGSSEQLLALKGMYYQLYQYQFSDLKRLEAR